MGLVRWKLRQVVRMTVATLLNKFDCFIIIEGNRGLGKSTLGYQILRGVSREFRNLTVQKNPRTILFYYKKVREKHGVTLDEFLEEIEELKKKHPYTFLPKRDLLYSRSEVLTFFTQWKKCGMADEMINVSFNRDFFEEGQKDLIKIMNMNRDHCNLLIACVPQFQTLDSQIKNLCKIRISVTRRGVAVVQTPNRTIYSRDKWDQAVNEKIEREWLKKGVQNPRYARLTTVRGIFTFKALSPVAEKVYQKVKDEKRNLIQSEEMGIKNKKEESPMDKTLNLLKNGKIRNGDALTAIAQVYGLTPESLRSGLAKRLQKEGVDSRVSNYYWDSKARLEEAPKKKLGEIGTLLQELKA